MPAPIVPTKGNLMAAKRSLTLARLGFDLMDRKRNILVREIMTLINEASEIQNLIDTTFRQAYASLQQANITLGICHEIAMAVNVDDGLAIRSRSVMGVEIPEVRYRESGDSAVPYGFDATNSMLDDAYVKFYKVKMLIVKLSQVENSVYRLAYAIKKAQRRANALKNVIIPDFSGRVKFITDALEEKDREEFTRLKLLKNQNS